MPGLGAFPDGGGEVMRGITDQRVALGFSPEPNSEPVRMNQTLVAANPGPELGPELAGDIDRVGLEMDEITIKDAAVLLSLTKTISVEAFLDYLTLASD